MGKSPGKWIKALLLGKKGSKSNLSKGREVLRTANENETLVVAKAPGVETPVVSHVAASTTTDENGRNIASENRVLSNEQHDSEILPRNQDQAFQGTTGPGAGSDSERARQDQAATKAQAAFRGYLARRAFRALKGIIRLQALIRGHLVRRQAAATLRCMQGIVRFQALVRGRRVRISDAGIEVHYKCNVGKIQEGQHLEPVKMNSKIQREVLSTNAFAVKLLASMSTALPLRLQYGPGEPNSALNWLERWSSTHFWQPLPQAKKNVDSKSQARQGNRQSAGTEPVRSKRTFRKLSTANVDNGSIHSTSESEKPKRSVRKVVSHPVDPVVDPQTELEKVKRSLRKVSSSTAEVSDRVEAEIEKPKRVPRKVSSAAAADVSDQGMVDSIEKIKKDAIVEAPKMPDVEASPVPKMPDVEATPVPKMPDVEATPMPKMLDVEATPMPLTSDEPVENVTAANHDKGVQALERGVQDENIPVTNSELNSKEDQTGSINPKSSKRRASLPAKQEYPENGLRNTPTVPSYMAATESAKAKLRAQGSPRFGHDEIEKNGFTRRHSLPSSTNGKLNSDSPRTQRLVNGSGKSGGRDRSLLSSRDGNAKAVQAEWRR